mmetsp:Transcript_25755/g.36401  ORF Transcript_25755/g.36401 Transcript_25755/m.36401 type:complete len:115 (-) Transcript_25755:42-386(-)
MQEGKIALTKLLSSLFSAFFFQGASSPAGCLVHFGKAGQIFEADNPREKRGTTRDNFLVPVGYQRPSSPNSTHISSDNNNGASRKYRFNPLAIAPEEYAATQVVFRQQLNSIIR